jgi:hypothetical protein
MEVSGQLHALAALSLGDSCTHWVVVCVGFRPGSAAVAKRNMAASTGNRTLVVQPIV